MPNLSPPLTDVRPPRAPRAPGVRRLLLWRWSALGVTALILLACLLPHPDVLLKTESLPLDKVGHFLAFAAFAYTWRKSGVSQALVIGLVVALAAGTEAAQNLWLPARSAEGLDVAADLVGAFLGLLSAYRGGTAPRDSSPIRTSGTRTSARQE